MSDFRDDYEMDEDGKLRKKKRVARDRERITFATISDHTAYGFSSTFADGSRDYTSPHAPGYRFQDTDNPLRQATEDAYEKRRQRMDYSNRRRQQEDSAPKRTLDETRTAADAAWEERSRRMQNAWRRKDAA